MGVAPDVGLDDVIGVGVVAGGGAAAGGGLPGDEGGAGAVAEVARAEAQLRRPGAGGDGDRNVYNKKQ